MNFTDTELAVLVTLAYTTQFSYPLTSSEIEQRLVSPLVASSFRQASTSLTPPQSDSKSVEVALTSLLAKKILFKKLGYYGLLKYKRGYALRAQRARSSQDKITDAQAFLRYARYIPWISAVFITGSVAMNNAPEAADTDFMIVTSPRRLWLTRLLVIAIATLSGKRRSWQGEEERSWCFNLWLSHDVLAVFDQRQSLYT
ncbi:MAG: hypothetical protein M3Q81_05725, partial [bacterium]|nr:hypothetical protein [bacterium]